MIANEIHVYVYVDVLYLGRCSTERGRLWLLVSMRVGKTADRIGVRYGHSFERVYS